MVIGNRMADIQPGAMPWLHRYVGNPVLTGLLNLFFRTGVSDAHCGMRAFRRDLLPELDLRTTGMEFASEWVIRASKLDLDIREIDDLLPPAQGRVEALLVLGRLAAPALPASAQPDLAVRHPGRPALGLGVVGSAVVALRGRALRPRVAVPRPDRLGRGAHRRRADPPDRGLRARLRPLLPGRARQAVRLARGRLRLEHGLVAGSLLLRVGFVIAAIVFAIWVDRGLGELARKALRWSG